MQSKMLQMLTTKIFNYLPNLNHNVETVRMVKSSQRILVNTFLEDLNPLHRDACFLLKLLKALRNVCAKTLFEAAGLIGRDLC